MYREQLISNEVYESARVDFDLMDVPPYIANQHVEGFLLSKRCCAPSHYLYPRFVEFPLWSQDLPRPTNEESLLASVDDELWKEFSLEFSKDFKAGNRNYFVFHFVSAAAVFSIISVMAGLDQNAGFDQSAVPFLTMLSCFVMYTLAYECLRESLFYKVDGTVARYQSRFAEKNIRASVVYYTLHIGETRWGSSYLVFTALPHPLTINII